MSSIHEECGLFGIYAPENCDVAGATYYGLFALQHRGQESCGIVVCNDGLFRYHKDVGLVGDVFTPRILSDLGEGNMAVGHVRYSTTGEPQRRNAQPIVVNHIKGHMALAHNGNLVNSFELRSELEMQGSIFHSTSDSEVIAYVITKERLSCGSIEEAVFRSMDRLDGAYSLVVMSPTKLIAARDRHGFRPLCIGQCSDGCFIVASESCAVEAVGGQFIRDIRPGEVLVIDKNGMRSIYDESKAVPQSLCVFEYVYFARPDSFIDGYSVHDARRRAGAFLAQDSPVEADVVIGVPDSGISAALGYAEESGIPYGIGFIKNKYIGRTFIAPGQAHREDRVKIKLNPVSATVKGKRVVMIDDSIVRGTTMAQIVKLLRDAGAKEIHVRSSAPPFLNPCYYGTDIDSRDKLIACKYTVDEICRIIGADSLAYLDTKHVAEIADPSLGICHACFSGEYPTKEPGPHPKHRFEVRLSDRDKEDDA